MSNKNKSLEALIFIRHYVKLKTIEIIIKKSILI